MIYIHKYIYFCISYRIYDNNNDKNVHRRTRILIAEQMTYSLLIDYNGAVLLFWQKLLPKYEMFVNTENRSHNELLRSLAKATVSPMRPDCCSRLWSVSRKVVIEQPIIIITIIYLSDWYWGKSENKYYGTVFVIFTKMWSFHSYNNDYNTLKFVAACIYNRFDYRQGHSWLTCEDIYIYIYINH